MRDSRSPITRPVHAALAAVLVLLLAAPGGAAAQVIGTAGTLIGAGKLDQALRLLEEVLERETETAVRAQALEMLADLALAEGDRQAARGYLERIRGEVPGTAEAWSAGVRIGLLDRLAAHEPEAAAPTVAPQSSDPTAAAPSAPAGAAGEAPAAAPRPLPQPAAPRPAPRPSTGAVLVAGDGLPPELIDETLGRFAEHLRERGVDARIPPKPIWWRRSFEMAQPQLLDAVAAAGATSLLWIDIQFGHRERLEARLIDPSGGRIWRVKASGGSGWAEDHRREEIGEKIIERLKTKLDDRIGQPGLPVAGG